MGRASPSKTLIQANKAMASYIEAAHLKRGDRLPAERELMDALGVGRSTIREVIGRLQALGVVESRKGSGTFLLKPINAETVHMPISLHRGNRREGLLQTLEIRRGIETAASELAALRRTSDDLVRIREKLEIMEAVHLATGSSGPEDLEFHLAVYDATQNPLFPQLLQQIREAFETFWDAPFNRRDFGRASFPFHRRLYDAILAQDVDAARCETNRMLDTVQNDILEMSVATTSQQQEPSFAK